MNIDISALRKEYREASLRRIDLLENPISQFIKWLEEALSAEIIEATAMALATCQPDGCPSSRMVLLKEVNQQGFTFFTNLDSRKAEQLKKKSRAAATFYWKELERQVCIEGATVEVGREAVETYFQKRPRQSQIGAWASQQSRAVSGREELEKRFRDMEKQWEGREMGTPEFWGGFRIVPHRIEFWQGRESRLHDRFVYVKSQSNWEINRLCP